MAHARRFAWVRLTRTGRRKKPLDQKQRRQPAADKRGLGEYEILYLRTHGVVLKPLVQRQGQKFGKLTAGAHFLKDSGGITPRWALSP